MIKHNALAKSKRHMTVELNLAGCDDREGGRERERASEKEREREAYLIYQLH